MLLVALGRVYALVLVPRSGGVLGPGPLEDVNAAVPSEHPSGSGGRSIRKGLARITGMRGVFSGKRGTSLPPGQFVALTKRPSGNAPL